MLKSIRIQNFKSLKDVTLDLQDVNLFIGPNNSGKSNVLKALKVLSFIKNYEGVLQSNKGDKSYSELLEEVNSVMSKILESTFNKIPLFDPRGVKVNPIKFRLSFEIDGKKINYYLDFFGYDKFEQCPIFSELIDYDNELLESISDFIPDKSENFIYHSRHNYSYKDLFSPNVSEGASYGTSPHLYDFAIKKENGITSKIFPVQNSISNGFSFEGRHFVSSIAPFFPDRIFKPDINLIQLPHGISNEQIYLMESCGNLASFIYKLDSDFPSNFKEFIDGLQKCIDEILIVKSTAVGEGAFSIRVHEKNGASHLVEDVSDGVIYFLSLMAIVSQPNPPKILLLEEPENGIHPRRIVEILEFIYKLVYNKKIQVIITTHSPILVDKFNDSTESVFVFDKEKGESKIKNLEKLIEEQNRKFGEDKIDYHNSLGTHWTMGFLGGVPK